MNKVNLKNYNITNALDFICNNYQPLGGDQRFYTAAVALQHLFFTGRLDSKTHNFVKNLSGNKIFSLIKELATKKRSEIFSYSQGHFESEWICKFKKIVK